MSDADMISDRPELVGETSRQGLRRMKRLAHECRIIKSSSTAIIHPTTGDLIYPAPSPHAGHVITSLYPGTTGRVLPVQAARNVSCSHDGRYIVLFHPATTGDGGTLAIYPRSILSPHASTKNIAPLSTLVLPQSPLDIVHLFPSRRYTPQGLSAQEGPHPPPGYDGAQGPVFLILVPDAIFLVHPLKTITGENWQMNVLKTPLHTRYQARSGDILHVTNGSGAISGWMGLVAGNDGVWVGLNMGERIRVLRVDVGLEETGRWYLRTTPMPRFFLPRSTSQDEEDSMRSLCAVCFFSPSSVEESEHIGEKKLEIQEISVAFVFLEHHISDTIRTRIDTLTFERKPVVLADGFGEISSLGDVTPSWEWNLALGVRSSVSPQGTCITHLQPTPAFGAQNLAVAVIESAHGSSLCQIRLDNESEEESDTWSAVQGVPIPLTGLQEVKGIALSQGVLRGCLGLVAVLTADRAVLVSMPQKDTVSGSDSISDEAENLVAQSIALAMKRKDDWSDVVRAATGYCKRSERAELVKKVFKKTFSLLGEGDKTNATLEISRIQVGLFGTYDHPRRDFASDVLRLQEASLLFSAMAIAKEGIVTFELDHVWPLTFMSEWVFATLATGLREMVMERAALEWDTEAQPTSLRLLYVINPYLRAMVLRLLAQVQAFIAFVSTINRPILPPETRPINGMLPMRDVRATALAKDRVKGMAMKQGVDVMKWGQALVALQKGSSATGADLEAFLNLQITLSREEVSKTLENLPNPSSLFMMEPQEEEVFDRVTFMRIPRSVGSKCNRCGGYTVFNVPGALAIRGGEGVWEQWKEERRGGCGCGGAWVR